MRLLLITAWNWLKMGVYVYRGLFFTVAYMPFLVWATMHEYSRSRPRREYFMREFGP